VHRAWVFGCQVPFHLWLLGGTSYVETIHAMLALRNRQGRRLPTVVVVVWCPLLGTRHTESSCLMKAAAQQFWVLGALSFVAPGRHNLCIWVV
jgi:hypothetical protein